jgi:hypothetical protein
VTQVEIAVVALLLVALALMFSLLLRRRYLLRGSGGITMSVRAGSAQDVDRGGWALGVGRFVRGELLWYRLVGLGLRPNYVLRRPELVVGGRRLPVGQEVQVLPADTVILDCVHGGRPLEIAVVGAAATGLSSWLESAAPDVGRGDLSG